MSEKPIEKTANKDEARLRILYLVLLLILGGLIVSIFYQTASQTLSSTLEITSRQEVVSAGDEISAVFRINNPSDETRRYTYALYMDEKRKYENKVTIRPDKSFVFGGHFRALDPGVVQVTALVYEEDKTRLLKNITYFVTVKP